MKMFLVKRGQPGSWFYFFAKAGDARQGGDLDVEIEVSEELVQEAAKPSDPKKTQGMLADMFQNAYTAPRPSQINTVPPIRKPNGV